MTILSLNKNNNNEQLHSLQTFAKLVLLIKMSSVIANLFLCIVGFVNVLNASTVYKVVPTRNEAGRYNGIGGLSGGGVSYARLVIVGLGTT